MVHTNAIRRNAQPSLFPCRGSSVKSETNGNNQIAKLSTYMTSREALWRLLATYPKDMPVMEAVRMAHVDFAKQRKEVAA